MFVDIIITLLGATLVLIGADKLTDGAVGLARRFLIPEIVIGLTIVALGTSLPEFIVSLLSCINHAPAMSIGNILGSNLFNTLMIVGCSAIFCPILVSNATASKDIPLSLLASIVLPALALDAMFGQQGSQNVLSRGDGIVLLCFFLIFMSYTFSLAKGGKSATASADGMSFGGHSATDGVPQMPVWQILLYIVLGLAGLIGGGELFVNGATGIARQMGVSEAVIGLTLVAGGTSLPELATSVIAARKGQSAMAIGNVIGSNLFNIFWILGCCACVTPLPVDGIVWTNFAVLIMANVLFWIFARTSHRVNRYEGACLVACYVAYIAYLITQA